MKFKKTGIPETLAELLQAYIDGHTIVYGEMEYTINDDGMWRYFPEIYASEIEKEEWTIRFDELIYLAETRNKAPKEES